MTTEVEVRSFISKEQYEKLIDFFKKEAKLVAKDLQETVYFDCKQDLRVQKNNSFAKIWLKEGKLHDDWREEVEVRIKREDFEKAKNIFKALEINEEIVWIRKRVEFLWKDEIKVCLDDTKGYGYIIELEKTTGNGKSREIHEKLVREMESLGVKITPKEEFQRKFDYYRKNWKKLIGR